MNGYLSSRVKRLFFRAGFEVIRLENSHSTIANTLNLIRVSMADVMIDVGANIGQFAREVLYLTTGIRIVSFEPLSQAHMHLTLKAANESRWLIAPRKALGSTEDTATLNIARNFASSSILPMQKAHLRAAPQSVYVGTEEVPVKRLDAVMHTYCRPNDKLYLKIDTQGYESQVITGAAGIMDRIFAIQLEASFVELYTKQKLAFEMIYDVQQLGFKLFGISHELQDPASGELLQANVYFVRSV